MRALIGLGPVRPKVRVTGIQVARMTPLALDLVVAIRVDNPNDFALDFSKLRYQMVAMGLPVAGGSYDPRVVIKEKASGEIRLPLSIDAVAALTLVRRLLSGKEDVTAVVSAVADFETAFGPLTVDFEDRRPLGKLAGF